MPDSTLTSTLSACAALLSRVGEEFWSQKLAEVAARSPLDRSDAREILGWFGGMGSFNDLILTRANGHSIAQSHEPQLNGEFTRMNQLIWSEAKKLAHS